MENTENAHAITLSEANEQATLVVADGQTSTVDAKEQATTLADANDHDIINGKFFFSYKIGKK